MSAHPSIETLRDLVTRDREFFKAQSQRLIEIQQSDPNSLSDVDKNALSNWDKSVVTDCNRQLLLLEEIKQPSAEERAIMKQLHELIILGDHIMEKRNLVRAELNDRLNAAKKSKAAKSAPLNKEKAEPAAEPSQDIHGNTDQKASVASTSSPADAVPDTAPVPSARTETSPRSQDSSPNNLEVGLIQDTVDTVNPKILYETLGVEPDAFLDEIKKAKRKAILRLHPDRNPDDPNAASRFADFQVACKVFETEEKRREFDDTGDVKEIDDLQARLQALAMK
ncbi:hypothetical protein MBLNU13_g04951t1 [Cladosporium sp. NU13]